MPTATFMNLPEDKKQVILAAAVKELSRVPFGETSINRIIQEADIPRGSFYMYFADKKDLVYYLMEEFTNYVVQQARQARQRSGGDLFALFTAMYDATFAYSRQSKYGDQVLRNLFISMRDAMPHPSDDIGLEELLALRRKLVGESGVLERIDRDRLRISSDQDLQDLIGMLLSITKHAIARTFFHGEDAGRSRERFLRQLDMVKYGVMKDAR